MITTLVSNTLTHHIFSLPTTTKCFLILETLLNHDVIHEVNQVISDQSTIFLQL